MKPIILILIALTITSCFQLTSGKRFKEEYLVMGGTIYANEYITVETPIFIGKTSSVQAIDISKLFLIDAKVFIRDIESSYEDNIQLIPGVNADEFKIGYYDPFNRLKIQPGKTYRLTAIVDSDSVWADTTVPQPFEILDNNGYTYDADGLYPQMCFHCIDELYTIILKVSSLAETPIVEEVYCLEEWENAYYIFNNFSSDKPETPEDYENYMRGYPRRVSYFNSYFPREVNGEYQIRTIANQMNFRFYGKNRLTLSLVDDNYFKYRYKSMPYFHGGVNNGIGYFASASRIVLYTEIIK